MLAGAAEGRVVARSAARWGIGLAGAAGTLLLLLGQPWAALSLILPAAVGIINAFWLEGIVVTVLQPERPKFTRRALGAVALRIGLWGLLFGVLYLLRREVVVWAVAAGIGCYLVALAVAGVGERS
jgi:predicted outer membrane lipoprotein